MVTDKFKNWIRGRKLPIAIAQSMSCAYCEVEGYAYGGFENGSICYGFLYGYGCDEGEQVTNIVTFIHQPTTDWQREYLHYALNDSFLAYVFETKDYEDGLMNGFHFDMTLSFTEVFAAMTFIREITLGNMSNPKVWEPLVGGDKEIAYAFAQKYPNHEEGHGINYLGGSDHDLFPNILDLEWFKGKRSLEVDMDAACENLICSPYLFDSYPQKRLTYTNPHGWSAFLKKLKRVKVKNVFGSSVEIVADTEENRKIIVEETFKRGCL